jgi:prepilin-type N-terminal cleavage/methylation domain-containing protein
MVYNCNAFQKIKISDKSCQKGYTLIEIVCVLAILGIICMILLPGISFIDSFYLDSISRDLLYDIRMVKNYNMSEPLKSYKILLTDYSYNVRGNVGQMASVIKSVELKKNYQIEYFAADVWFNANGTPKQAQTITIRNKSTGRYRYITINPNTGRILLYE